METEKCPDHGVQLVMGQGSTKGPDPYAVDKLACGCDVTCFGPGEPNVVISTGKPRKYREPDMENGPSERDWRF